MSILGRLMGAVEGNAARGTRTGRTVSRGTGRTVGGKGRTAGAGRGRTRTRATPPARRGMGRRGRPTTAASGLGRLVENFLRRR